MPAHRGLTVVTNLHREAKKWTRISKKIFALPANRQGVRWSVITLAEGTISSRFYPAIKGSGHALHAEILHLSLCSVDVRHCDPDAVGQPVWPARKSTFRCGVQLSGDSFPTMAVWAEEFVAVF